MSMHTRSEEPLASVMKITDSFNFMWIMFHVMTAENSCRVAQWTGVDHPGRCRYGRDIHPTENRMYLLLGESFQIPCCGYLIGWEFQASIRAALSRPINFQIWRPSQSTRDCCYSLIGHHDYWYIKGSSMTGTVLLKMNQYIHVTKGDVIGWHTPEGDIIDYGRGLRTDHSSAYLMLRGVQQMSKKHIVTLQHMTDVQYGRMYGIKVLLSPAVPPSIDNLPQTLTISTPFPAHRAIFTVKASLSMGKCPLEFSLYALQLWVSIHHGTGEVESTTTIDQELTLHVPITVSSVCGMSTSSTLTLQCVGSIQSSNKDNHSLAATLPTAQVRIQDMNDYSAKSDGDVMKFETENIIRPTTPRQDVKTGQNDYLSPSLGSSNTVENFAVTAADRSWNISTALTQTTAILSNLSLAGHEVPRNVAKKTQIIQKTVPPNLFLSNDDEIPRSVAKATIQIVNNTAQPKLLLEDHEISGNVSKATKEFTNNTVRHNLSLSDHEIPINVAEATTQITKNTACPVDDSTGHITEAKVSHSKVHQKRHQTTKQGSVILILVASLIVCSGTIVVLAYKLWKARKAVRRLQDGQTQNAVHDYRFDWVPRQIGEGEIHGTSVHADENIPPFSVTNQNFYFGSSSSRVGPRQDGPEFCGS